MQSAKTQTEGKGPGWYAFGRYVGARRWASYYHQIRDIMEVEPRSVLEVGVGSGIVRDVLWCTFDVAVSTLDVDESLNPDHVGSVTKIPFYAGSYDVASCCQVLEHLPYGDALRGLRALCHVARRRVVVSVPDASRGVQLSMHGALSPRRSVWVPLPGARAGLPAGSEHAWEVGRVGYPLRRVLSDFDGVVAGWRVVRTYRVQGFPWHRFFILDHVPHG